MPAPVLLSRGRLRGAGGFVPLGLMAVVMALTGCKPLPLQKENQSCGGDYGGCAKGLRCSFKEKRCYRPVNCAHLQRRMKACLTEVVSVYAPQAAKLPAQTRIKLLERVGQHVQTEVVDHCTYDAAAYQKKHSTKPTKTKSYGEDLRAKEVGACLQLQGCRPFANCMLGLARLVGPKRPSPKDPPVFPIVPPRPAPVMKPAPTMPAARPAAPAPVKRPTTPRPAPRPR